MSATGKGGTPTAPTTLAEARERIDMIDDALLGLLHQRASVVSHVGRLKKAEPSAPLNAFRPAREIHMLRRLREATFEPLTFTTVASVWREIISGFTAVQMPLEVLACGASERAAQALAREAFGAQARIRIVPDARALRTAMTAQPGALGVVPADAPSLAPFAAPDAPRIVAALPFIGAEPLAYALSNVPPEPGGDDVTVALAGAALHTVPGFITDIAALSRTLALPRESLHILGHYPRPLEE